MKQTAVQQQLKFDDGNAEVALIMLTTPDRYQGGLAEWAQMVANRLVTSEPGRYPALELAWAQRAYELAYRASDPNRETASEADNDELSDLRAWHRR